MTSKKQKSLWMSLLMVVAVVCCCLGFGINKTLSVKAEAAPTPTPTKVVALNHNSDFELVWFQLDGVDYGGTNDYNLNTPEILSKLSVLNTWDNILIDDVAVGGGWNEAKNPHFNYWGVSKPSLTAKLQALDIGSKVTIKAGCEFPSKAFVEGTGAYYATTEDVSFVLTILGWENTNLKQIDITDKLTVNFRGHDKSGESTAYYIHYDAIDMGKGEYLMDHDTILQDYITFNGRTISEVNADPKYQGLKYTTFPGSMGGVYGVPIRLHMGAKLLIFYIHDEVLNAEPIKTIGIKAGLRRVSGDNTQVFYTTKDFVAYNTVYNGTVTTNDIDEEKPWTLTVRDTFSNSVSKVSKLLYILIDSPDKSFDGVGYTLTDGTAIKKLQEVITLNGKTAAEINNMDTTDWVWPDSFPYSMGATYQKPIQFYGAVADDGVGSFLQLRVHENVVNDLGDDITVGVKGGIQFYNSKNKVFYTLENDVSGIGYYQKHTLNTHIGDSVNSAVYAHTQEIKLTDPVVKHYTFGGWFEDSACTIPMATSTMPAADYDIYAKLSPEIYDVTLTGEGVTESVEKVEYNNKVTVPENPAREGYRFDGWYNGDAKWNFESDVVTGNLTLTAKFTKLHTVTFSDGVDAQTVVDGEKAVKPEDLAKDGYRFDGWYNGDAKWNFESDVVSGDLTLTAQFTKLHTVTFSDGVKAQVVVDGEKAVKPENPSKDKTVDKVYTFDGWYNGDVAWNFDTAVTSDINLTAKFNEAVRKYTVSVIYEGIEETSATIEINYNEKLDFTQFQKEGYNFKVKKGENEITELLVNGDVSIKVVYKEEPIGCSSSFDGNVVMIIAALIACGALMVCRKRKHE